MFYAFLGLVVTTILFQNYLYIIVNIYEFIFVWTLKLKKIYIFNKNILQNNLIFVETIKIKSNSLVKLKVL